MAEDAPLDRLVVYSDYVCPFCYLGKASLERYRDGRDDAPEVDWRPFDLRAHKRRADGSLGDAPDGKDDAYFERVQKNVERLGREWGVEMTFDLPRHVDSWNAHKAALHVRRQFGEAAFLRFHHALFDALWKEARDIGDPDVVAAIAGTVGLDPDGVRAVAADEQADTALRAEFTRPQALGITGVPSFQFGRYLVPGAVPPEMLEEFVRRVRAAEGAGAEPEADRP